MRTGPLDGTQLANEEARIGVGLQGVSVVPKLGLICQRMQSVCVTSLSPLTPGMVQVCAFHAMHMYS
jgi:hypothetical protein